MHTIKIIAAGLALLAVMLLAGWSWRGAAGIAPAVWLFLPLWLAGSVLNLWVGVRKAGYTVREEFPVLLVVFLVPAVIACLAWWWLVH